MEETEKLGAHWAADSEVRSESRPLAGVWGEIGSGEFHQTKVHLASGERKVIETSLHSLGYVHAPERPSARIGIRSGARRESQLIAPIEWQNVWLEGWDICLLGWITRDEFSMRARPIREGSRVFQFVTTRVKNLAVDVSSLKPIYRLLEASRGD